MDSTLYVAMAGAVGSLEQQQLYANNLANVTTNGFMADIYQAESVYATGNGLDAQAFAVSKTNGVDFAPGPMISTGRDLDAAIKGDGFFAIQDKNGNEVYTRNGNFSVNKEGLLTTADGHLVLGDGGPISIPAADKIQIAGDGTITVVPDSSEPNALAVLDRLKLVKPNHQDLVKNNQGFLQLKNNGTANVDASVGVEAGMLEGSNVNAVEQMIHMINSSREFESHMKTMQTIDENDQSLARLLQL